MDFGTLLHTAKKNESTKKDVRYYSTKFEPPKKEQRNKTLSVNIQKFLAKKEAEEKQKSEEVRRKREDLLALRAQDKKSTRRVNVMLKRTKSANQSVIADAVNIDHTAVTMTGNSQPDEDDYGYVSQEAADFYNKMMEKYNKMPDEPKFPTNKRKISTNLNNTKNRVTAALEKEKEEANSPHKRRRKREEEVQKDVETEKYVEAPIQIKKPKPAPPPIMNFAELLKVAEKKQFEPIVIEKKEVKEDERPLTKKQKKELEKEKEYLERKNSLNQVKSSSSNSNRIPKLSANPNKNKDIISNVIKSSSNPPKYNGDNKTRINVENCPTSKINREPTKKSINDPKILKKDDLQKNQRLMEQKQTKYADKLKLDDGNKRMVGSPGKPAVYNGNSNNVLNKTMKKVEPVKSNILDKKSYLFENSKQNLTKPVSKYEPTAKRPLATLNNAKPKEFPPSDLKARQMLSKPKEFPPRDLKPKQFPPPDIRRGEMPKRKMMVQKGRILDDDEEDYDSEMDDFIDDGPQDDFSNNYSKYISEIFGYDKSKYKYAEDDVDNMESSFAQQMREEVISAKIGIMEDLEDMKKEEEEKKRKAMLKKKRK